MSAIRLPDAEARAAMDRAEAALDSELGQAGPTETQIAVRQAADALAGYEPCDERPEPEPLDFKVAFAVVEVLSPNQPVSAAIELAYRMSRLDIADLEIDALPLARAVADVLQDAFVAVPYTTGTWVIQRRDSRADEAGAMLTMDPDGTVEVYRAAPAFEPELVVKGRWPGRQP